MLRLAGVLFLLAAVVFCLSGGWWGAIVEGIGGVALLFASTRKTQAKAPLRRPPRRRGRP